MKKIVSLLTKHYWLVALILSLLITSIIKIVEVSGYNFAFTMDQGRDMVDIRHMVVTFTPRLVGPTTSINGVLLGPFWYYFNLIPFIISGGNPTVIVYWQILWYQLSVVALWVVLMRKNMTFATIISIFLLFMPTGFNIARYSWNANSMTFFTIIYFAILILTVRRKTGLNLIILGFFSGLSMQIEAAFGIIFFPFALIYLLANKTSFKKAIVLTLGFFLTVLPQALFEIKHNFHMTRTLIAEFTGKSQMLEQKISLVERLDQRWEHLVDLIRKTNHLPENIVFILFIICLAVFLLNVIFKKIRNDDYKTWSLSFIFVLFSALFYLAFPQKLKIWYTLGLSAPLVIFLGGFVAYLFQSKNKIFQAVSLIIIGLTLVYSIKAQLLYINTVALKPSDNRSILKNELFALDWIYKNAEGKGFKAYSYLPSVYDFPYNHLFWWYGTQKYGYQPEETAYLPNQPEYIRDLDKIWTKKKNTDSNNLTFLILEEDGDMPVRTQQWLGNFSKLCLIKKEIFSWHAEVWMMGECNQ